MFRRVLHFALVSSAMSTGAVASSVQPIDCDTVLPTAVTPAAPRALMPEDLVALRDIGPVDPQSFAEPFFTLSPDGRSAAFQLRQGSAQRNDYCVAMVVLDLTTRRARIVDKGRDPILWTSDFRGIADFPSGLMRVITPRWSKDGRWIAFLKRVNGSTQVWRADADGRGSRAVTHSLVDVTDFRISPDGASIVYVTRPDIERQRSENLKDGLNGWHYDDRFVPWISKAPMPRPPIERAVEVIDAERSVVRQPTPEEARLVATDRQLIAIAGEAPSLDDRTLEIKATTLSGGAQAGAFSARLNGAKSICRAAACEGAVSPWRMPGQAHVRFLRREGWANGSTAIYDWNVETGDVRRLYETDDVLSSCAPVDRHLLCLIDSSLRPRQLVRLDPETGSRETLFDPNPDFSQLALGKVERLHWRNRLGVETLGDLILPVGYRQGERYPLVIVQYDTRGFLRGGTDDEYPIQAFSNRGYAVLSFSSPRSPVAKLKPKDFEQAGRLDLHRFGGRRNIQASLEAGVELLVRRGIADPRKIGITGLSDGSTTVEWMLNHSSIFSAAAMSSCCWDPGFVARLGPSAAKHFLAEGYPGILGRNDPFWKDMALESNARRITTPILVNASEEEFLAALQTYTALREAGVPIDLFVYPGEYHSRWQPAHRLATYRRSLDWFDYWLRDIRSTAPDRQIELKEWDRLKHEAGHGRPI